jgi:hypothetical protein
VANSFPLASGSIAYENKITMKQVAPQLNEVNLDRRFLAITVTGIWDNLQPV